MVNNYSKKKYYPLAYMVLDIDYLKFINDRFGHAVGDEKIQSVAKVLTDVFRSTDVVARTGGDEFAVLLPKTDASKVNLLIKRIELAIENQNDVNVDSVPISVTTGFYISSEDFQESMEELSAKADKNMYSNKDKSHKLYFKRLSKWCDNNNVEPPRNKRR